MKLLQILSVTTLCLLTLTSCQQPRTTNTDVAYNFKNYQPKTIATDPLKQTDTYKEQLLNLRADAQEELDIEQLEVTNRNNEALKERKREEKLAEIRRDQELKQQALKRKNTTPAETYNTIATTKVVYFNDNIKNTNLNHSCDYDSIIASCCANEGLPQEFTDIVKAIIMQESGFNPSSSNGYAAGLLQIENTLAEDFAQYGQLITGEAWTLDDRYNPEKNLMYGIHRIALLYKHYNGDIYKTLQGYNFSSFSLDKLIDAFGDDWINHRDEVAYYNGVFNRTGSTHYGDANYVEHVLRYYN